MPWVRIPRSSLLITSGIFVVFVLDMASPGYGKFALIPDFRSQVATLTTDVRSDLENVTRSQSSPTPKTQSPTREANCRTLLDAYKPGAKCHFEPPTYSSSSP